MTAYIPDFIERKYMEGEFKGEFKAIAIFCDISGFTSLTEEMLKHGREGSEVLTNSILNVFNPAVEIIYKHGGFITTFAGDAFTALITYDEKDVLKNDIASINAISAAREIISFFKKNCNIETKFGCFNLEVKIGIADGQVEWGIVGSIERFNYYFRGEAIDKASDIEHKTCKGEFRVSEELEKYLNADFPEAEVTHKPITRNNIEVFSKFFPDTLKNWKTAEFRYVCTIFLVFKGNLDYNLLNKLFIMTNEEVDNFGGFCSRLDFGDKGAKFLIFFGFPVSHEDDIRRALSFISTWKQRLIKDGIPIFYRIGVSFGLVYAGISGGQRRAEFTCYADAVNYAARLAFTDSWQEIYCSESVAETARSFARIPLSLYREFKGKSHKLPVYRFMKLVDLPHRKKFAIPLIGREKDFQYLKQVISETILKRKCGGFFYIHGEPGIGKSRLVFALLEWLETENLHHNWAFLPCDSLVSRRLDGLKRFLRKYFDLKGHNRQEDKNIFLESINKLINNRKISEDVRSELAKTYSFMADELGIRIEQSLSETIDDSEIRKANLFICITEFFKALSEEKPLLIEIDDAQWIDGMTEELVSFLSRHLMKSPVIFLITSRYKENGEKVNLDIHSSCIINEIELKLLTEGSELSFLKAILHEGEPDEDLINLLKEKAKSNPFYLEQWILHLNEKKLIELENNIWKLKSMEVELPDSIDNLLVARIDSLGVKVKEVLQYASVLGQRFAIKILLSMLTSRSIESDLSSAEEINIISPEEIGKPLIDLNYLFTHILYRDVAYEMQLFETRKKLHKLAFEIIEDNFKDRIEDFYDDLCIHSEKAELTEKHKYYLKIAGDYYLEHYYAKEALEKFSKLELLVDDKQELADLYIKISEIYKITGPLSMSERYLRSALDMIKDNDNDRRLKIYTRLIMTCKLLGNYSTADDFVRKALDIVPLTDDLFLLARLHISISSFYTTADKIDLSLEYLKKSLSYAEKTGDLSLIASVNMEFASLYLSSLGNGSLAEPCILKCLQIYKKMDRKVEYANACNYLSDVCLIKGEFKQSEELLIEANSVFNEVNYKKGIVDTLGGLANIALTKNDRRKALEYYHKILGIIEEVGDKVGITICLANIGKSYLELNELEKSKEFLLKALQNCEEMGEKGLKAYSLISYGNIFLKENKLSMSEEIFKEALNISEETGINEDIADACEALGDLCLKRRDLEGLKYYYDRMLSIYKDINWISYIHVKSVKYLESLLEFKEFKDIEKVKAIYNDAMEVSRNINDDRIISILEEIKGKFGF
ncbi:MAG: tetratricopeptide repeat protein [Candidatus Coatesbacteria bacterium]|nr:tetratricopeptide repeat protein [Candidatus Coatesbacteria bacterium]